MVLLAAVETVEVGPAIDAQQHGLTIDHEGSIAVAQRSFGDQREPAAPVMTVAGPKPNARAVALEDKAISVVLDLMEPVRPVRNLRRIGRDAGVKRGFQHAGLDSRRR